MTNAIPYLVGGLTTATSAIAQVSNAGNPSLWIQAGMAGVVVLLLLKFFPMILAHQRAESEANREIVREIVAANQAKDEAWQKIVAEKKLCPKDANGN